MIVMLQFFLRLGKQFRRKIGRSFQIVPVSQAKPTLRTIYVEPAAPVLPDSPTRDELETQSYCSICFEQFTDADSIVKCRRRHCQACYHRRCIDKWTRQTGRDQTYCVMCTKSIRRRPRKKRSVVTQPATRPCSHINNTVATRSRQRPDRDHW